MEEKKELVQEVKEETVAFEEMEKAEEFGSAQDYITGISVGIGIVVGIVTLT